MKACDHIRSPAVRLPEASMAVAAEADWNLDIGTEASENGGKIVAQGTPEKIAKSRTSRTAPFLKTAPGV